MHRKNQLCFGSSIAAKLARWALFCISFSAKNKTFITFLTASLAAPLWVRRDSVGAFLRYVFNKRQRREQQHLLPSLATRISCRSFANGSQLGSERLLCKCSSVICSEDVPLRSRAAFEAHNEVLIKGLRLGKFWIILTPLEFDPLPDCALLFFPASCLLQARDDILNGSHPVSFDKACEFAGIQAQIQFGPHAEHKHKPGFLE